MPRVVWALLFGVASLALVGAILFSSPAAVSRGRPDQTLQSDATAASKRRFQRLVNQVSAAVEGGNSATARELTRQALTTFEMIPPGERDVDSRYHEAMLKAVAGDEAGALAEAAAILLDSPGNLLGYYVRGVVARLRADWRGAGEARAEFTARFQVEMAKARPEYIEHRPLLEAFLRRPESHLRPGPYGSAARGNTRETT